MTKTIEWLDRFNAQVAYVMSLNIYVQILSDSIILTGNNNTVEIKDEEYETWIQGSIELSKELNVDPKLVMLYFAHDYVDALFPDDDV